MPPKIDTHKCNGCNGREETHCEEICPGDLMALNPATGKAYLRAARDCWDCMSCIKACPAGALEIKMPYQLGYFKASLRPIMGSNFIIWKCRDINGKEQTYRYVNRLDKA